ncbi:MAG: peptidylprolyl isomerase [SAR202 cluster bacterium]|nr:peptidylprolyl isomerase [SAR202 cluster bacterium]
MNMVKNGDIVSVHYHGTLDDGQIFDSSRPRGEPLTFTVGSGQVIPGFNNAVLGLEVGGIVKVRMEAADAYGEKNEQLVFEVPTEGAPEGLKEGDRVQLTNGAPAVVVSISKESITLDANHELAGKALTFEIELMSIN